MARWTVFIITGLLALISLMGAGLYISRRSPDWFALPGRMYATA